MRTENNAWNKQRNEIGNRLITFNDERNRSKLITYLDRIGTYNGFDKEMKVRIFTDIDNDFCAFEAVDYRISFMSTNHKIIDMLNECRVVEADISQLRSMIAMN